MPKVFLTGSGVTKGYVTGSGFISNPPRYLIRQFDSATGSYPTIARTGDVSRIGNYNVSFDDTNTMIFDDPYAEAEINFDMVFQTKIVPIATPGIYYGPVNSRILGEGFKEVIEPTIRETLLSPLNGDTITLTDTDGSSVVFTFKSGLDLTGLANNEVQLPLNRYNRKLLARNFAEKINAHPDIKIQAILLDEPKNIRLSGRNNSGNREVFANGTIRLRQQKPGTAGNKAITKVFNAPTVFGNLEGISITNFSGGKDNNRIFYPQVLDSDMPLRIQKQGIATPNFSSTNLDNSGGVIRKGISDAHIRFTKGEDLTAFNDTRIDIRGDRFYEVGTPENIYPGFSNKLSDKTQIVIDVSTVQDKYVLRQGVTQSQDSNGQFYNRNMTGFCYYNWDTKLWNDIGLTDPATGGDVGFKFNYGYDNSSPNPLLIGHAKYTSQFGAPSGYGQLHNPTYATLTTASYLDIFGYGASCAPHIQQGAPFGNLYHATGSQALSMSSFINSPFLLEKITIDIPASVRMWADDNFEAIDDISNYVFFLYKQDDNFVSPDVEVDSLSHVTSSNRILIASGAASFTKSSIFNTALSKMVENPSAGPTGPAHKPSFYHNFNVTGPARSEYTGSLKIEMLPEVSNIIANIQMVPGTEEGSAAGTGMVFESLTWPGGHGSNNYLKRHRINSTTTFDEAFGKDASTATGIITSNDPANTNKRNYLYYNELNVETLPSYLNTNMNNIDTSRRIVNCIGSSDSIPGKFFGSFSTFPLTKIGSKRSSVSPFILMPNDKIILGVEQAGSKTLALSYRSDPSVPGATLLKDYNKSFQSLSGSLMQILPKEAKITLYGSQIKDGVEFHDTLNQPLTSDAIHEAIHYDNPTIDQFNIAQRTEYIGGYLDDYNSDGFVLRLVDPASRIGKSVGSIISGSAGGENTAFTRYSQSHCFSQIYFDSMLPKVDDVIRTFSDPITDPNFTIALEGGTSTNFWGSYSAPAQTYPFDLQFNGVQIAFKPKSFIKVTNFPDFLDYGASDDGFMPANFQLSVRGNTGFNKNAQDFVDSAASLLKNPVPYFDNTDNTTRQDSNSNFRIQYAVFDLTEFKLNESFVHPFRFNPERFVTQNSRLNLLISQVNAMTASQTTRVEGGVTIADSHRDKVIEGISPKAEFLSGEGIVRSLFGGTAASLQQTIENNKQLAGAGYAINQRAIPNQTPYALGTGLMNNITTNANAAIGKSDLEGAEGLSYGLINATAQRRKSYYRSDRFTGQVADLVHPGFDTAFSQLGARLGRDIRNFKNTRSEPLEPPVIIKFVSGSNVKPQNDTKGRKFKLMKPEDLRVIQGRQSSNMSVFATSSMPFFDDDVSRN